MARTRQLPSGRWQGLYDANGRRHITVGRTFTSEALALKAAERDQESAACGELPDRAGLRTRFDDYGQRHVSSYDYGDEATRDRDRSLLRNHFVRLDAVVLGRIQPSDVREWYSALKSAPATQALCRQLLGRIMDQAEDDNLIRRSPTRHIKWAKTKARIAQSKRADRWLTRDELHALADVIDPRLRAVILVMGYMGLRPGEIAGLTWDHVNLLRGQIEIVWELQEHKGHHKLKEPKTAAGLRTLEMPAFVQAVLTQHLDNFAVPARAVDTIYGEQEHPFVFTGEEGAPLRKSWVRRRFRPAAEQVGLLLVPRRPKLRPHHLRHTNAALLIDQGIGAKELQEWLGHSSFQVTMDVYGHLFPAAQQRIVAALNRVHEDSEAV